MKQIGIIQKPFIPSVSYGKVIKCYDVDTITIVAKPYKLHLYLDFQSDYLGLMVLRLEQKMKMRRKLLKYRKNI